MEDASKAKISAGADSDILGASHHELDLILNGDYNNVFQAQEHFSLDGSTSHIFEVIEGNGIMRSNVGGDELVKMIKKDNHPPGQLQLQAKGKSKSYDTRVIFIDCIQKDEERLSVTSTVLRAIFDVFDISPQFAASISRQHMPGSTTSFDLSTYKPRQHEMWYSAVIRLNWLYGDGTARDLCRMVSDWQRFSLWSNYDLVTKRSHILVLGCPQYMRDNFQSVFQGNFGLQLQRHPMIIHAYFARNLLLKTYDFLQEFSPPLYKWEFQAQQLKSASNYQKRVQVFLAFSRQIQQISTDYDILDATLEHLKKEYEWFQDNIFTKAISKITAEASIRNRIEPHAPLRETFDSFLREAKLLRTYSNLYNEKTKIGVSEGFAMVNQRDAEVNIKMATESTQIARAAHQDSRALRIIQILSMLFLPASLVSSIFGMGFFSTSQGTDGQAVFTISRNWWLYLAISAPLTGLCVVLMGFYNTMQRPMAIQTLDIERAPEYECELKED